MIYLYGLENEGNKQKVHNIHFMPLDEVHGLHKSIQELEVEGLIVDELPREEMQTGKIGVLYCNMETKSVWYEYVDAPKAQPTVEEQLETLKLMVADLGLMVGGGL